MAGLEITVVFAIGLCCSASMIARERDLCLNSERKEEKENPGETKVLHCSVCLMIVRKRFDGEDIE